MTTDFEAQEDALWAIAQYLERIAQALEKMIQPEKPLSAKEKKAIAQPVDQDTPFAPLEAAILDKLWAFQQQYPTGNSKHGFGKWSVKIGDLTREINAKREKEMPIQAQRIGHILRDVLVMKISMRMRDGYWVYWDEGQLGPSTMEKGL